MNKLFVVSIIMSFVFSAFASENNIDYMPHRVFKKNKAFTPPKIKTNISTNTRKDEALKLLKRGAKANLLKSTGILPSSTPTQTRIQKKFFQRYLKNLKTPIEVTEIDNGLSDVLRLKLVDSNDKYVIEEVKYKIGELNQAFKSVQTTLEGNTAYADINISEIEFGSYKIYFEFGAQKIEKKDKKVLKAFLGEGNFEKVAKAFAILSYWHEADKGYANISASQSYSDAGSIVNYTFNLYFGGELVDSYSQQWDSIWYNFKDVGEFKVEVIVEDDKGNKSTSEPLFFNITNSVPILKYELTQKTEPVGHYRLDMSASYDLDGDKIQSYEVILFDENWSWITGYYSTDPIVDFAAPKQGAFKILIVINDPTPQADTAVIEYTHNGPIAPKYLGHYFIKTDHNPTHYYFGADYSDDTGIKEFHYKATHEDGSVLMPFLSDYSQHNRFDFQKKGNYTLEFYAIDNDGLKSDVHTEQVNIYWEDSELAPRQAWHYMVQSAEDPRIWWTGSEYYDLLDGYITGYNYFAVHEDGTRIESDRPGQQHVGFYFIKKGNWTVHVVVTDNQGFTTEDTWTRYITWDFDKPTANITLAQDTNDPYRFNVSENNSYPISWESKWTVKYTHNESGETGGFSGTGTHFYFDLWKRGAWTVEYFYEDPFGLKSNTQTLNINIAKTNFDISLAALDTQTFDLSVTNVSDPYGYLPQNYNVTATHEAGQSFSLQTASFPVTLDLNETGDWNILVESIDQTGRKSGASSQTVYSEVPKLPPVAYLFTGPGVEWNQIFVDGSWSYDPDGYITNYHFEFMHSSGYLLEVDTIEPWGDYTLPYEGTWTISMLISDNDGLVSELQTEHVELIKPNLPPVASFTCDNSEFLKLRCDASSSSDDNNQIVSYKYFLDGVEHVSSGSNIIFDFIESGVHLVGLQVTDDLGQNSGVVSQSYEVRVHLAPVVEINCYNSQDNKLTCDSRNSIVYDDVGIDSYSWEINGVGYDSGALLEHQLLAAGTYHISLLITDNMGYSGSAEKSIVISELNTPVSLINMSLLENVTLKSNPYIDIIVSNFELLDLDKLPEFEVEGELCEIITTDSTESIIRVDSRCIKSGENYIRYYGVDVTNSLVAGELEVFLGEHDVTFQDSSFIEYKLYSLNNQNLVLKSATGEFYGVPEGDYVALGVGEDIQFDIIKVDKLTHVELTNEAPFVSSIDNNDYTFGVQGWEVIRGSVEVVDKYDQIYGETEKVLELSGDEGGLLRISRNYVNTSAKKYVSTEHTVPSAFRGKAVAIVKNITTKEYDIRLINTSESQTEAVKLYVESNTSDVIGMEILAVGSIRGNVVKKQKKGIELVSTAYANSNFQNFLINKKIKNTDMKIFSASLKRNTEISGVSNNFLSGFSIGEIPEGEFLYSKTDEDALKSFFNNYTNGLKLQEYNPLKLDVLLSTNGLDVDKVAVFFLSDNNLIAVADAYQDHDENYLINLASVSGISNYNTVSAQVCVFSTLDGLEDCKPITSVSRLEGNIFQIYSWYNAQSTYSKMDFDKGGDKWVSNEFKDIPGKLDYGAEINDISFIHGGKSSDHPSSHKFGEDFDIAIPKKDDEEVFDSARNYKFTQRSALKIGNYLEGRIEELSNRLKDIVLTFRFYASGKYEKLGVYRDLGKAAFQGEHFSRCMANGTVAANWHKYEKDLHRNHHHLAFLAAHRGVNILPKKEDFVGFKARYVALYDKEVEGLELGRNKFRLLFYDKNDKKITSPVFYENLILIGIDGNNKYVLKSDFKIDNTEVVIPETYNEIEFSKFLVVFKGDWHVSKNPWHEVNYTKDYFKCETSEIDIPTHSGTIHSYISDDSIDMYHADIDQTIKAEATGLYVNYYSIQDHNKFMGVDSYDNFKDFTPNTKKVLLGKTTQAAYMYVEPTESLGNTTYLLAQKLNPNDNISSIGITEYKFVPDKLISWELHWKKNQVNDIVNLVSYEEPVIEKGNVRWTDDHSRFNNKVSNIFYEVNGSARFVTNPYEICQESSRVNANVCGLVTYNMYYNQAYTYKNEGNCHKIVLDCNIARGEDVVYQCNENGCSKQGE